MVYRFNNQLKEGPYNNSKVQPSDQTKAERYQSSHLRVDDDDDDDDDDGDRSSSNTTTIIHNDSSAKQYGLTSLHMIRFIKELSLSKSKRNLYNDEDV